MARNLSKGTNLFNITRVIFLLFVYGKFDILYIFDSFCIHVSLLEQLHYSNRILFSNWHRQGDVIDMQTPCSARIDSVNNSSRILWKDFVAISRILSILVCKSSYADLEAGRFGSSVRCSWMFEFANNYYNITNIYVQYKFDR